MRLSWNEIRTRATEFALSWKGHGYEKGETQLFYQGFFNVFGMSVRRVASFEAPVKLLGEKRGFIDLIWKGVLLVEQKSEGYDLAKARKQAFDYFAGLNEAELPRYILLSDFQTFELLDLDNNVEHHFNLEDLWKNVEHFSFIMGVRQRTFKDQDPVNIIASERIGELHDALKATGYDGHDLEQLLVRIVFCLFADDTGIFPTRDMFLDHIESRTSEDGADLGQSLAMLFQVLNTPENKRPSNLDEDLQRFPYVNGDLFRDPLAIASFDSKMRRLLLTACTFDWSAISPAIFGSLFQSVMDTEERRKHGAHYTTEKNILKVIEPLLMDDLRAEFERLKARKDTRRQTELTAFQERLGKVKLLDPACGCGNFLVIAYRELRSLELEVIRELRTYEAEAIQLVTDVSDLSVVNVDQFFGIELFEFPARIAETAMWMMDHIMNNRLSLEFGQSFVRIPLKKSPHILNTDALETPWEDLLLATECTAVLGNPPFSGAKYQSEKQRAQVRRIAGLGKSGGTLDFVAAWFILAAKYVQKGAAKIGFVATNSITQGEQVAQLWPLLYKYGIDIIFAYRTFAWGSDARGKAHVHVVVVGLGYREKKASDQRKVLFNVGSGDVVHENVYAAISPYLIDGGRLRNHQIVVREEPHPTNGLPRLITGTKPIDGGYYIFSEDEYAEFINKEPGAKAWMRPFVGAREYINGIRRWILCPMIIPPDLLKTMPSILERIRLVRHFREQSTSIPTQALAATATSFHVTVLPTSSYLAVPQVSSERREYVPMGWLDPPVVPSDKLRVLLNAEMWHFGILTSAMHMAWMRLVTGRMKSDYMYSVGVVFNTFPMPRVGVELLRGIEPFAARVLKSRADYPKASLADLYDPNTMPASLRNAHRALDIAVDRLYRKQRYKSDLERMEYLLELYEANRLPL